MSLRDGRLSGPLGEAFSSMNASIGVDRRLYRQDIRGSKAYARALHRCGVLGGEELEAIERGLEEIEREIAGGTFAFRIEDEDIHMNIERRLREKIGEAALKLHTGRSRNEQVVLDERLFLIEEAARLRRLLSGLAGALVKRAREERETVAPSYTHLRKARPVSLAHLFLAYCEALLRHRERLEDYGKRLKVLPLGSGASAGSTLDLDREALLGELPFDRLSENSMDAVSTRDFMAEYQFIASCVMVTLSRMAEDIIIFSSEELGFYDLPDELCTTSSLMPQKKNPDSLELIRGKSARVIGNLVSLLTLVKGLPYTYDRDLQEDKQGLFETVDGLNASLEVMRAVIEGLRVDRGRIARVLESSGGLLFATDLVDYLVQRGVPFREAHRAVGAAARRAVETGAALPDLPLEVYRGFSPAFEDDLYAVFDYRRSVDRHDVPGGTALGRIDREIRRVEQLLGD